MQPCHECGNRSVRSTVLDGVAVLECELCGALAGSSPSVRKVQAARDARDHGVDPRLYGLVRAIGALPGVRIHEHHIGDPNGGVAPFVSWLAVDARGYVQLENLAKMLVLSAATLALPWTIAVEFRDALAFVLRPMLPSSPGRHELQQAQNDLSLLQRAVERDVRLSWWRQAPG